MKKMTFALLMLLFATTMKAQTNYVNVGRAGTLQQILEQKGYMDSEGLVIAGELNGRDIAFLRTLTGSIIYEDYTEATGLPTVKTPKLKTLDLYDARIVGGGGPYTSNVEDVLYDPRYVFTWPYTTDDVVGKCMFTPYWTTTLTDIILPSTTIKIDELALNRCVIKRLYVPDEVESLGLCAINSSGLERLVLPASLQAIGENCFGNAKGLQYIYCQAATPPEFIDSSTNSIYNYVEYVPPFPAKAYENCELVVPEGCAEAYRNSDWGAFVHISETIDFETLIADMKPVHHDIPVDMVEEAPGKVCKVLVEDPGTLQQVLEEKRMTDAEELIIGGPLNGSDFAYLRILCGVRNRFFTYAFLEQSNLPEEVGRKLKRLNLFDARIVSGGGPYVKGNGDIDQWPHTEDDVAGYRLLDGIWRLTEIILPESTKKIDHAVFYGDLGLDGTFYVPEGVENLGRGVFSGCRELEQVVLPTMLGTLGWEVFRDCHKLRAIYCLNPTPPVIEKDYRMFSEYTLNEGKLIVPAGCAGTYRNAYGWGSFKNIVEADDIEALVAPYKPQHHDFSVPTAVAPVSAYKDGTGTQVFNLSGMRLTQPARGLNIIRMEDGKVRKVIK